MEQALIAEVIEQKLSLATPGIAGALKRREPLHIPDLNQVPMTPLSTIILRAGFRRCLPPPWCGPVKSSAC